MAAKRRKSDHVRGTGSIRQRPNGKWQGELFLGRDESGKRIVRYATGDSELDVSDALAKLRQEYKGTTVAPERHTIESFLRSWLGHVEENNAARTHEGYADMLERHVYPALGKTKLAELNVTQLRNLFSTLNKKYKRVPSLVYSILHAAFAKGVKWGFLTKNILDNIDKPTQQQAEIVPMTKEQAELFLAAVEGHRLDALFQTLLGLGLRISEALAVQRIDINFKEKTIRVRNAKVHRNGSQPKTTTLPLPEQLIQPLKDHLARMDDEQAKRLSAGLDWPEPGLVFPSDEGTPLDRTNVHRTYKILLKKAELPQSFRLHDLRHSCATFLLTGGTDIRVVQTILRHANISMTEHYTRHVAQDLQRAALDNSALPKQKKKQ